MQRWQSLTSASYFTEPIFRSLPSTNRRQASLCLYFCVPAIAEYPSEGLGPINYAACTGSGVGGGTPFETDGVFHINSDYRLAEIKDGKSKTLAECRKVS